MQITRRTFLEQAAALAVAVGASGEEQAESQLPIIDTHQHLWDVTRIKPPWLDGSPDILRRSYVTKDYLEATHGLNVVKAIYMEIAADPRQHVEEAEYLIEICRSGQHPTVAAVISGRPNSEQFRSYILRYKDNPYIKGVRQVLHGETPAGYCLQPQFVQSIRLLGEIGMSFDLCLRPGELADGVRLVELCPETRFILDHCGNADVNAFLPEKARGSEPPSHDPDQWRRDIEGLAQRKNIICKISGIVARGRRGIGRLTFSRRSSTIASIRSVRIVWCLAAIGPSVCAVQVTAAGSKRYARSFRSAVSSTSASCSTTTPQSSTACKGRANTTFSVHRSVNS